MKLRVFTEPQQGASYDQLRVVAQCAEEEGTDAWITLAGLSRDT